MGVVTDLQVQVGGFAFHGYPQQIVNVHRTRAVLVGDLTPLMMRPA
jgi:hypothetical protein